MFSPTLLGHFQHPRNTGELPPPAIRVEVSNPACGDSMVLSARIDGGRIVEARYLVRGCTASIAAGSVFTEILQGLTVPEAALVTADQIDDALGGLPAASRHAAALCMDALKTLLKATR